MKTVIKTTLPSSLHSSVNTEYCTLFEITSLYKFRLHTTWTITKEQEKKCIM